MAFPQFQKFPAEIQFMIFNQCPLNDQICLRLTCKSLFCVKTNTPRPILSPLVTSFWSKECKEADNTPAPGLYDAPTPHADAPFLRTPSQHSFLAPTPCPSPSTEHPHFPNGLISLAQTSDPNPLCGHIYTDWTALYEHRKSCHSLSYATFKAHNDAVGTPTREMINKCRTDGWQYNHCDCYTRPNKLYMRLRSWMPEGMRYCGQCNKFTTRMTSDAGRCYHGKEKPKKKFKGHLWTQTRRRGWCGDVLYRMLSKDDLMISSLEGRTRSGVEGTDRKGCGRYNMRSLRGRFVDTREERGNLSEYRKMK